MLHHACGDLLPHRASTRSGTDVGRWVLTCCCHFNSHQRYSNWVHFWVLCKPVLPHQIQWSISKWAKSSRGAVSVMLKQEMSQLYLNCLYLEIVCLYALFDVRFTNVQSWKRQTCLLMPWTRCYIIWAMYAQHI